MTSYEFEYALVYIAEQIIKTFGKDVGVQVLKQKPAEPLFKDEKIREAVKNWVLTNYKNHMIIEFDSNMNGFYMFLDNTDLSLCGITFQPDIELGLEEREYTFAELCGESEQ